MGEFFFFRGGWGGISPYSVPARKFCLRAKVAPTTHFLGARFFKKGPNVNLIGKREETVGKLRK